VQDSDPTGRKWRESGSVIHNGRLDCLGDEICRRKLPSMALAGAAWKFHQAAQHRAGLHLTASMSAMRPLLNDSPLPPEPNQAAENQAAGTEVEGPSKRPPRADVLPTEAIT